MDHGRASDFPRDVYLLDGTAGNGCLNTGQTTSQTQDLRGNPPRRFKSGSASPKTHKSVSHGSMPDAPSPKRCLSARRSQGGPGAEAPPGGPERDLSEVAAREPAPKTGKQKDKAKTKHKGNTMTVLPRSSNHRRNEDARFGVQSVEPKQISAGRPLRQGELPEEAEREICPSLGNKHPEEELEDTEASQRRRRQKASQYHATVAPPRGHVGVGIRPEPSETAREHVIPGIHSDSRGSRKAARTKEGPEEGPQQKPRSRKKPLMVFTPKAGAGTLMATAESVDEAGSQRAKGARAKQYHAAGAPPQGKVAGGIGSQPSDTAGSRKVHSTDSLKRTRHEPRQSGWSSGAAVGAPRCGDHPMMEPRTGERTSATATVARMVTAPDNSTESAHSPRSGQGPLMDNGQTMSRDQRKPRPAMRVRVPNTSVTPECGDRTEMEYTFTSVHTQKDKRAQHVSQTVLVRDSQPVGAAAGGSSHQRSESSLAPKSDWLETRRKEKPLARRARDETAKSPSHQRNLSGAGTPGRGGIFNRVTQRVETPTKRPARGAGGIALAQPNPHIPTHRGEVNRSATVQGESERSVTPLSGDTRSTMWVSETGADQQSLPHKAATVWTAEQRGNGGQESAHSANADASALVAALQDDEEAPLGESRNATQTQQSTTPCATPFECSDCGRAFKTKAGRTLHSKARHPVEANAEVVVERVKPRWEAEERYLLAKREVELRRAGSRFLNVDLRNSFPARTLESIKGQRKKDEYKQLVQRLTQETVPAGGVTDAEEKEEDPRPTGSAQGTEGESAILEHLRKLIQKPCPRKFQSDILWDIAKQACEGVVVSAKLDDYLRHVFVCDKGPSHGRAGDRQAKGPTSRRKRKRREYARMQEFFRKRQGDCARGVLDGTPEVLVEDPAHLLAQWEEVMCPPGHEMATPTTAVMQEEGTSEAKVNLFYPVTSREVTSNLPPVKSAPGPDGFTARLLRTVPNTTLEVIMNLMALVKRVPTSLRGARTTFIPKKSPAKCYSDFRPITVSSVLLRLYHRILAKRLINELDFDYRQRAFTPVDGCAENVFLLASVLEDAKQKLRPLHMASLDLSKAFDRVTTEAVLRGARRAGLDQGFLDYLQDLYEDSWTKLTLEGSSRVVHPTVGVRQGDPLSPLLFNLVVDEFLQTLDPGIGYSSDQLQLDGMAFADDLIVFASTPEGLQRRLDSLHSFVGARGLAINAEKSFTVSIVPSGREKRTKVVTTGNFSVSGIPLPACGIEARWKYLGVEFSPNGRNVPLTKDVASMLERVAKAPLKPQQRLVILRFYLIPRLYHRLVLGRWNRKLLKRLDVQIRDAVRKWMALPHDTPLGYYHAPVAEGGLGVGSFSTAIPWMQVQRLSRMATSSSPICRQAADTYMVKTALDRAKKACVVRGNILSDKQSVGKHWSALLHASNDGHALREVRQVPAAQRWVQEGTGLLTGRAFIDVNKLRINALPVRTRTKRGRDTDKNCRGGCRASETLDHVLQKCHRTHAARIKRHDGLVQIVVDRLRKKGWTVEVEKRFNGPQTLIPDIVARRVLRENTPLEKRESAVIDATVITCGYPLLKAHESKVRKYDVPQVTSICKGKNTEHPLVTSATLNFRGVWCKQSAQDLLSLGLTKQDLKIMTVRCLQGGIHCFRVHHGMTSVK